MVKAGLVTAASMGLKGEAWKSEPARQVCWMTKTAHPKANILVAGAGGFIGGHLVAYLRKQGMNNIRAVDLNPPLAHSF